MKLKTLFFILVATLLVGCFTSLPSPVENSRTIAILPSKRQNFMSIGCLVSYSLNNKYNKLDDRTQLQAIANAFNKVHDSYKSLRFTDVSSNLTAVSNIKIYFTTTSDTVKFNKVRYDDSLLETYTEELSTIKQNSSRDYTIYINSNFDWTPQHITRVILFHIGYIIGLPILDRETSIMYPKLTNISAQPDNLDTENIKKVFPNGCQLWQSYTSAFPSTFNVYRSKFFKIGERTYALSEDRYPVFYLYEFNNIKSTWEERKSLILSSTDFGLDIEDLFVVGSKTNGFVGIGTSFFAEKEESGEFWSYNSVKNEWTELKDSYFPKKYFSIGKLYAHTNEQSGFVLATTTSSLDVWKFDLATVKWQALNSYSRGLDSYFMQFVGNNNYIYGFDASKEEVLKFDFSDNKWSILKKETKFDYNSSIVCSLVDNNEVYVILQRSRFNELENKSERLPYQIWTFNINNGFGSKWELLATTPENLKFDYIYGGFIANNRIFLYTNNNLLLEFLP